MTDGSNGEILLELSEVGVSYGEVKVLEGINLSVRKGEIVTLLGPNGAGKTTLMLAIMGFLPIKEGTIKFSKQIINGLPTERIVKLGLTLVPEGKILFSTMSTFDNLLLGTYPQRGKERGDESKGRFATVFGLFPVLQKRRKQQAGTLSGGEQQMVAVGRGLMSGPQLLLLDEPSLGLAPLLVEEVMKIVDTLRGQQGISILLSEQNAAAALEIADRGYVLSVGKVVLEGSSHELKATEAIKSAYLGG